MRKDEFQNWTGGPAAGDPFGDAARVYGRLFNDWAMMAQMIAAQDGAGAPGMDAWRAYAQPFAQMMAGSVSAAGPYGRGQPGTQGAVSPELAALMQCLAQAHMQLMVSGFRYMNTIGEFYRAKYTQLAGQIMSDAGSQRDLRYLMDEARSYIRQVADLSLKEARILQVELEKIEFQMNQILGEEAQSDGPARHWKVKP